MPLSVRWPRGLMYLGLFVVAGAIALLLSNTLNHIDRWVSPSLPEAGGATTLTNRSSHAFTLPAPGLNAEEQELHAQGDAAFDALFVTAPATLNPGLGPLFNNASCVSCHIKNGRGMPEMGQNLVRVSLPTTPDQPIDPTQGVVLVPNIGGQVRDQAIFGYQPDAAVRLTWQEQTDRYADGTVYHLRLPVVQLAQTDPNKPLPKALLTSLRMPPPVFGVGLLEAVPESTLEALADPEDRNRDDISGRPNYVWDAETQTKSIGRFGLKANAPNLRQQTAAAYFNDMGVSNPVFPDADGQQDIDEPTLKAATFYVETLGVPARTQVEDPVVRRGEKLFTQANCDVCHVATLKTGAAAVAVLTHQVIHPYTDLLLHDMGEGLADHRPDFEANGQEWRTSPLWGLGLTQTVLPYSGYLHDGRARTVEEAILWHGGEAEASQQQFKAMPSKDRSALLKFLNSL